MQLGVTASQNSAQKLRVFSRNQPSDGLSRSSRATVPRILFAPARLYSHVACSGVSASRRVGAASSRFRDERNIPAKRTHRGTCHPCAGWGCPAVPDMDRSSDARGVDRSGAARHRADRSLSFLPPPGDLDMLRGPGPDRAAALGKEGCRPNCERFGKNFGSMVVTLRRTSSTPEFVDSDRITRLLLHLDLLATDP